MHENDKYPECPNSSSSWMKTAPYMNTPTYSRYIEDVNADTLREAYRLMSSPADSTTRQPPCSARVSSPSGYPAEARKPHRSAPHSPTHPTTTSSPPTVSTPSPSTRGVDFRDLITIFRGSTTHGWDMKAHNFHTYTRCLPPRPCTQSATPWV